MRAKVESPEGVIAVRANSSRRDPAEANPIGVAGRNCQAVTRADRVAWLIDAAEYYRRLREALYRARRSIHIIGWDFDSRVDLLREAGQGPVRIGDVLNDVVSRQRHLHAYIVIWDYSTIFALDREPLTIFRMGWRNHRRIHVRYDAKHPFGACRHEKLVVIDNRVAFCGGLDIAERRWDTPEHGPANELRRDQSGRPYTPVHDVQLCVSGETAELLGHLARDRWRAVARRGPVRPEQGDHDPWPPDLEPHFRDARVLLARTQPEFGGRSGVREVERLYLDSIRAARRTIYIENQYFASAVIAEALGRRLQEPDGPEIVMVLPLGCSGWLEERTMGARRQKLLGRLKAMDRHRRFCACWPKAGADQAIHIHSKVMVVDDHLLRVGSSNLVNRSMGMDSECDLAVEGTDPESRKSIRRFRDQLVAEHLGVQPEELAGAMGASDSLVQAIDALRSGERTLVSLNEEPQDPGAPPPPAVFDLTELSDLADPERPMEVTRLIDRFLPEIEEERRVRQWYWLVAASLASVSLVLFLGWKTGGWLRFVDFIREAQDGLPAPLLVVPAAFIVGQALFVPLNLLMLLGFILLGGWEGLLPVALGAYSTTLTGYLLGRVAGRSTVRVVAGRRLNRLSRKLSRHGVSAVAAVRLLPVASAQLVNLVCGASKIRWGSYLLGSLLGILPGVLLLSLLGEGARRLLLEPGPGSIGLFLVIATPIALGLAWIRGQLDNHVVGPASGHG